ncbi:carbamate kinase [Sulfitobacter guttiformis]|uniref:Carbamate kinase n=1 Tax=Sulfitobacter guttiformis TaxID=74349 RepID=A0A420DJ97_9RHOB|nr:carbamate kinase [Sulfitobacter guttiformis]KIN71900.1 Carbamate kinase [Sulfitobacter guttiformis KCTC 32187]RKE94291.1 carbamate kinase [Sulfitobacter guttiformis]
MRIVVALGGNALLRRDEPMTPSAQRTNVRIAAVALADLALEHQIIVAHGNGPQVGLLALHGAAYDPAKPWPLDVLGAETEGMIGYLIEQELMNALPDGSLCATLLSRVEVDPDDPAFSAPSKPIGPAYSADEAKLVAADHGWEMAKEASGDLRRVVPSPLPQRIVGLEAIKTLLDAQHIVICAGGGGIPVLRNNSGDMEGVEAVIDKDRTSALLASDLGADALLLLTDVAAVFKDFGGPDEAAIHHITPEALEALDLAAGSMGPKGAAAAAFVRSSGKFAGIGQLSDARAILEGRAGTRIAPNPEPIKK